MRCFDLIYLLPVLYMMVFEIVSYLSDTNPTNRSIIIMINSHESH